MNYVRDVNRAVTSDVAGDVNVNPVIARRTALAAALAGGGAVALAACSSGSSSSGSAPAKAGQQVARLDDIKVGEAIAATVAGNDVLVSRPTATTAACFSAICTHEGCTVQPDGTKLRCPCHGSIYDATTGEVLQGPAPTPLNKVAVTVKNGEVVTT